MSKLVNILKLLLLASLVLANEPVILTNSNIQQVLKDSELVFVAFVAEWCHFSRLLTPVWKETSKALASTYPSDKLTLAVVQTDKGGKDLGIQYSINKYPTMKLFRHGIVSKKEYRGARSIDAFTTYINDQFKPTLVTFSKAEDLISGTGIDPNTNQVIKAVNRANKNVIGYFSDANSENYKSFSALANNLKDDCSFYAGLGPDLADERLSGDNIVFKPQGESNSDQVFLGDISNQKTVNNWINEKCVPLVRQITFHNGEELTELGHPFLILFHKKEDTESLDYYTNLAQSDLKDQRDKLTILHADCDQFAHPLWHLGKSVNDCPVIAIDSFKHMYTFPKYQDIKIQGKLREFVEDLHSGKLHREFHNGPDPEPLKQIEAKIEKKEIDPEDLVVETKIKVETVKQEPGQDPNKAPIKLTEEKVVVNKKDGKVLMTTVVPKSDNSKDMGSKNDQDSAKLPPKSAFAKLKPSSNRYSIPGDRDEL